MANKFETFLAKAGKVALKIITFGAIAAKDAAPFLAPFEPALATLLGGAASIIIAAESAGAGAISAAPTTDTSTQKAALAVSSITPLAEQFAKQLGLPTPTQDQIQGFSNDLVSALNRFQAPTTTLTPAA
jgi:hypothetical protein